ncbi:GNAT family N-acetyltransferase [Alteromonas gilva]|uniref:GNAT family N-acetyltransferase n=1 Tax=Alteromonas gilva TaxID=2987522 RepID=A0ABT5L5K2_9ALTE|nr:GNAT family N-acetyltransferase [Alteromonas gilva]MDC8831761.1 GNAT family N-acetyltransferase [Alteromonas gilva]
MLHIADSQRLSFRLVTADDHDFLFQLDQDEAVMRYINGGKKTSRQEIDEVFMPRVMAFSNPQKGWGLWQVRVNTRSPVGWILVRPMGFFSGNRDDSNLELGWRFSRAVWGQGIATEAAKAVMQALLANGITQFSAIALKSNTASINVMGKLGMSFSHSERYQDAVFDEQVEVYTVRHN